MVDLDGFCQYGERLIIGKERGRRLSTVTDQSAEPGFPALKAGRLKADRET